MKILDNRVPLDMANLIPLEGNAEGIGIDNQADCAYQRTVQERSVQKPQLSWQALRFWLLVRMPHN
jgi:hypothetical protein